MKGSHDPWRFPNESGNLIFSSAFIHLFLSGSLCALCVKSCPTAYRFACLLTPASACPCRRRFHKDSFKIRSDQESEREEIMNALEQRTMETIIHYLPELVRQLKRLNEILEESKAEEEDDHEKE